MEKKREHLTFEIDCPIFSEYKDQIRKLVDSIKSPKVSSEKVDQAKALLNIVDVLMNCPKYEETDENCHNCYFFLKLKRETARIIVKVNSQSFERHM